MDLKDQITNYELSKKLEELGVKQDSLFGWYTYMDSKPFPDFISCVDEHEDPTGSHMNHNKFICSAFTIAELGEMLPYEASLVDGKFTFFCKLYHLKSKHGCYCSYRTEQDYERDLEVEAVSADTEANARAKMLIWLIENVKVKV